MINTRNIVSKYIISGLAASGMMFCSLAFFHEILGIWYLYSSTIAFVLAFTTSFLLQKFWTFKDRGGRRTGWQLTFFFLVSLVNLGLNALGMSILVSGFGWWYLASQLVVASLIALWSFFAYRAIFMESRADTYEKIISF